MATTEPQLSSEGVALTVPINPVRLQRLLEQQYQRFYDSAYAFADPQLAAERRWLMGKSGLSTDIILEPVPGYASSHRQFASFAAELELGDDVAEFVSPLMEGSELYEHQANSVRRYLAAEHVVITAGTGSGKTEAFLIPLLTHLVTESRGWGGAGATPKPWWERSSKLALAREGEFGRDAGMRGLVLYPMNALVEDQMVRLRRVLDAETQLRWLGENRAGHRFYFGRYTGQTPHRDLQRVMRGLSRRAAEAEKLGPGHRAYVARPLGAEMLTREDMQLYPPDILITNYSMLNVMLNRRDEAAIFEQTADYLDAEDARFHLVVDELHSYKGTAGTEVAMLLRRLLHRLGLDLDSPKLRILAASASLGDDEDAARGYLQEFFGADGKQFAILRGTQRELGDAPDTQLPTEAVDAFTAIGRAILGGDADEHKRSQPSSASQRPSRVEHKLGVRLVEASRRGNEVVASRRQEISLPRSSRHLQRTERGTALAGRSLCCSLRSRGTEDAARRRRASRSERTSSSARSPAGGHAREPTARRCRSSSVPADRTVGKLYAQPTIRCECGARCLDLWACADLRRPPARRLRIA